MRSSLLILLCCCGIEIGCKPKPVVVERETIVERPATEVNIQREATPAPRPATQPNTDSRPNVDVNIGNGRGVDVDVQRKPANDAADKK
jgi:hypothetical protein